MKSIMLDFDDYCNENNILPSLEYLKTKLPNLKVNLFTIPHKTSNALLKRTAKNEWIHMIPHGFKHNDNYECAHMSRHRSKVKLNKINSQFFRKGFKAPGWQISVGMMKALQDKGWWVAVQWKDDRMFGHPDGPFQPGVLPGLRYYSLNEQNQYDVIHGHCQEVCGNGLKQLWQKLIALPENTKFEFIDDIIK